MKRGIRTNEHATTFGPCQLLGQTGVLHSRFTVNFISHNDEWKNRDMKNEPLKTIAHAAPIAPKNGAYAGYFSGSDITIFQQNGTKL